jgi:hypothetical protein
MFSDDDPLKDLLDPAAVPHASDNERPVVRESVLTQTTSVIRFRRRMRRVGAIAALAGCYLAGVLTMSVWRSANQHPAAPGSAGGFATRIEPKAESGDGQWAPARPLIRPEDDGVIPGPRQAQVVKFSPYDRLRRAGDRQLEDENDIAAAARTYRRALTVASPAEMNIFPDQDTWLLMAMKNDQTNKLASEDVQ